MHRTGPLPCDDLEVFDILLSAEPDAPAPWVGAGAQRLDAMVRTQDGFELAELDLELRGPGEFFGTRQAGLPEFRVANLVRDRELLELAKREVAAFVAAGGAEATEAERAIVASRLKRAWQRRYGLVEAG